MSLQLWIAAFGEAVLYVNGNEYGYEGFDGDFSNDGLLEIGIGFGGLMDNVIISKGAINIPEIRSMIAAAQQPRQPVNFTPTGGDTAAWQFTVSDAIELGREGFHQIDLHAVDAAGNRRRLNNVWQGMIDTLPPRITIEDEVTGLFYLDPDSGEPANDIGYTITAEDLHLDPERFETLCNDRTEAERRYLDADLQEDLFPDLTLRNRLRYECHDWVEGVNPTVEVTACDLYDNCTTLSQNADTSSMLFAQQATTAEPVVLGHPLAASLPRVTRLRSRWRSHLTRR